MYIGSKIVGTALVVRFQVIECLQSMRYKKINQNNVNPCKPQFYYLKLGGRGSKLHWHVSRMDIRTRIFFNKLITTLVNN